MYEVYDINTGETIHRVRSMAEAVRIARDTNKGKLDKLYEVREAGR